LTILDVGAGACGRAAGPWKATLIVSVRVARRQTILIIRRRDIRLDMRRALTGARLNCGCCDVGLLALQPVGGARAGGWLAGSVVVTGLLLIGFVWA
jgi:hypothetical protein